MTLRTAVFRFLSLAERLQRGRALGEGIQVDGHDTFPCAELVAGVHSVASMSELDELQAKITHLSNVAWHFCRDRPKLDGMVYG